MTSNFQHLSENWAGLFKAAPQVAENTYTAPRTSVFYSRYSLEAALAWIFQNDSALSQLGLEIEPTMLGRCK